MISSHCPRVCPPPLPAPPLLATNCPPDLGPQVSHLSPHNGGVSNCLFRSSRQFIFQIEIIDRMKAYLELLLAT